MSKANSTNYVMKYRFAKEDSLVWLNLVFSFVKRGKKREKESEQITL